MISEMRNHPKLGFQLANANKDLCLSKYYSVIQREKAVAVSKLIFSGINRSNRSYFSPSNAVELENNLRFLKKEEWFFSYPNFL